MIVLGLLALAHDRPLIFFGAVAAVAVIVILAIIVTITDHVRGAHWREVAEDRRERSWPST